MASELPACSARDAYAIARLFVILVAMSPVACRDDGVTLAPKVPLAYTRFIHAVADTCATDWRFIDQLENSPVSFGLTFRRTTSYQATAPGNRRLRVFPTSTNIGTTSSFLIDTILPLENDTYYTIVHMGYASTGQVPAHKILLLKDDIPETVAGKIAIRVVHLGTALGQVDVFADTLGGVAPLPPSPLFGNRAFGSASPYELRDTSRLALRVTSTGQTSPVVASGIGPAGQAGDPALNLTAIGGSRMGRSVISAFLFPRSVPGIPTACAFTSPGLVFLIDKHPR